MRDFAFASVRAAHNPAIEKEKLLRIKSRLVVDIDMGCEIGSLALVGPPCVFTPRAGRGKKDPGSGRIRKLIVASLKQ